jgi:hypothetical protein
VTKAAFGAQFTKCGTVRVTISVVLTDFQKTHTTHKSGWQTSLEKTLSLRRNRRTDQIV